MWKGNDALYVLPCDLMANALAFGTYIILQLYRGGGEGYWGALFGWWPGVTTLLTNQHVVFVQLCGVLTKVN